MSDIRDTVLRYSVIGILALACIYAGAQWLLSLQQARRGAGVNAAVTADATDVAAVTAVQTATALPTSTPMPVSTPTMTPKPTNTPEPTVVPTSVYAAQLDELERFFLVIPDEFEGSTMYAPLSLQRILTGAKGAALAIIVWQHADGEVIVNWGAAYRGDDWVFIEQLRVKVGTTIYDVDEIGPFEGKRNVYLGGVTESVAVIYRERTHRPIIDAILADPDNVTIRLAGDNGDADAALSRDEALGIVAAIRLAERLRK